MSWTLKAWVGQPRSGDRSLSACAGAGTQSQRGLTPSALLLLRPLASGWDRAAIAVRGPQLVAQTVGSSASHSHEPVPHSVSLETLADTTPFLGGTDQIPDIVPKKTHCPCPGAGSQSAQESVSASPGGQQEPAWAASGIQGSLGPPLSATWSWLGFRGHANALAPRRLLPAAGVQGDGLVQEAHVLGHLLGGGQRRQSGVQERTVLSSARPCSRGQGGSYRRTGTEKQRTCHPLKYAGYT